MPFTYAIMGKLEAQETLSKNFHGFTHVVSCRGSENYYPEALDDFDGEMLILTMDDVSDTRDKACPKTEHIEALLNFNIPHGSNVLFHCAAGISRSSACAWIKLCQAYGKGFEYKALAEIMRNRYCAYPNILMVSIADNMMNRKGEMRQAYAKEFLDRADDEDMKLILPSSLKS